MSFELRATTIISPVFRPTIDKIVQIDLPVKIAKEVRYLVKQIDNVTKEITSVQASLIKKFAEKDEEGRVVPDKDKETGEFIQGSFVIPEENQAELNQEGLKLMNRSFTIKADKIQFTDLETARLSVLDLEILEPMIEGMDDFEENIEE